MNMFSRPAERTLVFRLSEDPLRLFDDGSDREGGIVSEAVVGKTFPVDLIVKQRRERNWRRTHGSQR